MISSLVAESRLPVGSSAKNQRRPIDQRTGDRNPLLLAAGKLVGHMVEALVESDQRQNFDRPLMPLLARKAVVHHRQLDVFQGGGARQQIKSLKDKTDPLVADMRPLVRATASRPPVLPGNTCPRSADRDNQGCS